MDALELIVWWGYLMAFLAIFCFVTLAMVCPEWSLIVWSGVIFIGAPVLISILVLDRLRQR